jgi:hypothetical protein
MLSSRSFEFCLERVEAGFISGPPTGTYDTFNPCLTSCRYELYATVPGVPRRKLGGNTELRIYTGFLSGGYRGTDGTNLHCTIKVDTNEVGKI